MANLNLDKCVDSLVAVNQAYRTKLASILDDFFLFILCTFLNNGRDGMLSISSSLYVGSYCQCSAICPCTHTIATARCCCFLLANR